MSERDELAKLILNNFHAGATAGSSWRLHPDAAADAILAAGYRRIILDDATVERAARALYKNEGGNWNTAPDGLKDDWRKSVRDTIAALTAAVESR
jgi:hypothetical protein